MNLALPGILQSLAEFVSPLPKPFDQNAIRAVMPDASKEKTLAGHIRECHTRYVEIRVELQDLRIEHARMMRLLWVLIGIALAGNASALQAVANFVLN